MTWFVKGPITGHTYVLPRLPALLGDAPYRRAIEGRTILITGASSGIGAQAALKLGGLGATVLLVARDEQALREVALGVAERGGVAHVLPADLSDPADVDRLLARVREHHEVDVLVNNAGRSIRRSVALSVEREHDYERTMALNYHGALRMILGLLPGMREREHGQVINISTMGTQWGPPKFSAYLASKAALDTFTRCAAAELAGSGIAFTTVHMPLVRTPMIAPTGAYRNAPAMEPEDAAMWIVDAIRQRPRIMGNPIGIVGQLSYAVAPSVVDQLMHRVHRATRSKDRIVAERTDDAQVGPPAGS